MTLTLTIELPAEVEAELRASVFRGDDERVRQLLVDALTPTVEALFDDIPEPTNLEEWEALADKFIDEMAAVLPPDAPLLSDYAVSREGIYEDHL